MSLCPPDAMSGTDVGSTRPVSPYALPTSCPVLASPYAVLTWRLVLPGYVYGRLAVRPTPRPACASVGRAGYVWRSVSYACAAARCQY
eukprot:2059379-Rhodomonas_salina.2